MFLFMSYLQAVHCIREVGQQIGNSTKGKARCDVVYAVGAGLDVSVLKRFSDPTVWLRWREER